MIRLLLVFLLALFAAAWFAPAPQPCGVTLTHDEVISMRHIAAEAATGRP